MPDTYSCLFSEAATREYVQDLLYSAKEAHMNMLRVWGGSHDLMLTKFSTDAYEGRRRKRVKGYFSLRMIGQYWPTAVPSIKADRLVDLVA